MKSIVLSTFNARYAHTALGLRYIHANMGELAECTRILEWVIDVNTHVAAEQLLALNPSIIGLAVYIWNVNDCEKLVSLIKSVSPETVIILGGPEISYESSAHKMAELADYVVTGWGEHTFPALCRTILEGARPSEKIQIGHQLKLDAIHMPYELYTDEDIAHRTLYVESSRGCPFRCEFCLSSLDKTAWSFDTDRFLQEMDKLYQRGARSFKFIDRTFNLNIAKTRRILQFFLDKIRIDPADPVFVHFEVVPDRLPSTLKTLLSDFPPGTLQLEVGVQSLNPDVQERISRRQDNDKTLDNIRWLRQHTQAHLHTDLIIGLPGESLASFESGFDLLVGLGPHEIQVGMLKRLKGTPILRHQDAFRLVFDAAAPYTVLSTSEIDFFTMQRLSRFARFWDMIANSGRFSKTLALILGNSPFERFMALSDWLYASGRATHRIALDRLAFMINEWLVLQGLDEATVRITIGQDYAGKIRPTTRQSDKRSTGNISQTPLRQQRHLQ